MLADFERKLAAIYYPADHPAWKVAHEVAQAALTDARKRVAEAFRELGIPRRSHRTSTSAGMAEARTLLRAVARNYATSPRPRST